MPMYICVCIRLYIYIYIYIYICTRTRIYTYKYINMHIFMFVISYGNHIIYRILISVVTKNNKTNIIKISNINNKRLIN